MPMITWYANPFMLCAYMIDNDECSNAWELTLGNITRSNSYAAPGTTAAATQSNTTTLPSCGIDGTMMTCGINLLPSRPEIFTSRLSLQYILIAQAT